MSSTRFTKRGEVPGATVSRAFAKRTTAAEESCTTGVLTEGRMAGEVGTVWERERTV